MNVVTVTLLTVAAVTLVIVAVFHRAVPSDWLIERPLRRLPSTPSIIKRVVGARRRQVLWSCLCGLAGLGIGVLFRLTEPAITTIITLSLVLSPAGRAVLTSSDALEPADTLVLCTLAVVILIVCDVVIIWINQLPSSAGTDLELVWDEAVKATTAQRILEYAPAAAGCSAVYLYITFYGALHPSQTVALVVTYVLWFASTFLPTHLPSKPPAPVLDERVRS